jgi:ribosomal protein S18 acetylase RimI-like enzyme
MDGRSLLPACRHFRQSNALISQRRRYELQSGLASAQTDKSSIDQPFVENDAVFKLASTGKLQNENLPYFIRPALMVDMGRASKILSDGFFKHKTNFFTYQLERLQTFLSLESTFPKPNTYHEIFVACCAKKGTVWGVVEVDARMDGSDRSVTVKDDGPYMCNLAVDDKCQRMGIASALVRECERLVMEWHEDDKQRRIRDGTLDDPTTIRVSNSLCLRVRESNTPAVHLYAKLGYRSMLQEAEDKTGEIVLLMRKQLFDRK